MKIKFQEEDEKRIREVFIVKLDEKYMIMENLEAKIVILRNDIQKKDM